MTTITIQANSTYADKIYQKLKSDKNIEKVFIKKQSKQKKNGLDEIALTMPGKPADENELLLSLVRASRTENVSLKNARKKTLSKIMEQAANDSQFLRDVEEIGEDFRAI